MSVRWGVYRPMRARRSHVDRGRDVQEDFSEEVTFEVRQSLLGVHC